MIVREQVKELVKQYYSWYNEVSLTIHPSCLFSISQNIEEMIQVGEYLQGRKFNCFVELGCAHGGSLWLYSHMLCNPNANIVAIEVNRREDLNFTFEKFRNTTDFKLKWYQSFSHLTTIEENQVDLLHIDAGHTYEGVRNDWNTWYPRVISGGVIMIHDTLAHDGCIQIRQELERENKYNMRTFQAQYPYGITVIIK